MNIAPNKMTQAAYAKARELSRQRVNQLVKDGRIPLDQDGLVVVDQADSHLATMLDQRKANRHRQIASDKSSTIETETPLPLHEYSQQHKTEGRIADGQRPEGSNTVNYWEHKARRERYEADRTELDHLERIGQLVSVADVREANFRRYRTLRDKLLNIPDRVATILAAERDPSRVHQQLTTEIKRVLSELSTEAIAAAAERAK